LLEVQDADRPEVPSGRAAWRFGWTLAALGAALFVWFTIALAFIDQETGYLPDDLTLPLVWTGLIINIPGTYAPLQDAVIGAAAGYLSLWMIFWAFKLATGKEGMGYGDFKMNAAAGAFLGWKLLPLVILLSSLVGLVFGLLQMFAARRHWDAGFRFHFGPYLAIAGIVAMFWGEPMIRWYLNRT
jgi:leader peptidase (prepilin peptidase)/N-methyltransferase